MIDYIGQLLTFTILDVKEVLPYFKIGAFTCLAAILFITLVFHKKKKESYYKMIRLSILAGYIVIVICITFWSREPGTRDGIDLKLFSTLGLHVRGDAFVFENILLFLPIGMLLPSLGQRWRPAWRCLLAGGCLSIVIEIVQLITKRGFFQIDDIVTNTLGCAIGYVIYRTLRKLWKMAVN